MIQAISNDVRATITRWREDPQRCDAKSLAALPWFQTEDVKGYADVCTTKAAELVAHGLPADGGHRDTSRFCLVTKRPHVADDASVIRVLSRVLAFGVDVHEVRRVPAAQGIADVLYPAARAHFMDPPSTPTMWDMIMRRFGGEQFRTVFGVDFSPELVMSGSQAMSKFGLAADELTAVWEEGRRPISRATFERRYGPAAADTVMGGGDAYSWFRGQWPVGIQRVASGVMAFAMRHELLGDGRPVIVLNGHFPGLAELFDAGATVIGAGLRATGPAIDDVRRWLVGDDNRPQSCLPGTVRRDAADGLFPVDGQARIDSRRNLVHCSDGLLAGMIEYRALLQRERCEGALPRRLQQRGLIEQEISSIVAVDPFVATDAGGHRLTELTQGQDLDECTATIGRVVPAVFGAANGFASGLTIECLSRKLGHVADLPDRTLSRLGSRPSVRPLRHRGLRPSSLSGEDERAGLATIARGGAALLAPAGGTGGRFGGYGVPEGDPRRQKTLVPAFDVAGAACSSLDIRLANAMYWRRRLGTSVPVAVMASPTSTESIGTWCERNRSVGVADLFMYQQFGTYRIRAERYEAAVSRGRWVDAILRDRDGAPSLKPPGNLGALTCLALSGILDRWSITGVEILAIANGDDVGFRLDPKVLGFLQHHPEVDAVVLAVPWGVRGEISRGGRRLTVHGDLSGWSMDETGATGRLEPLGDNGWGVIIDGTRHAVTTPSWDVGGVVCEVHDGTGWRVAVAEDSSDLKFDRESLFNTNQMYIRLSALQRIMGIRPGGVVAAVQDFVDSLPFYLERKTVAVDGVETVALQLSQVVADVVERMRVVPMLISRSPADGQRGCHVPLKRPADTAFAQVFLDQLAAECDEISVVRQPRRPQRADSDRR